VNIASLIFHDLLQEQITAGDVYDCFSVVTRTLASGSFGTEFAE
jgi:hypothetical protein